MGNAVTAKYVLKAVLSIFLALLQELTRKITATLSNLTFFKSSPSSVDYYSGEIMYNEFAGTVSTGASHILMMYGTSPCPVSVPIKKVIESIKRRLAVMEYGEYVVKNRGGEGNRDRDKGCVVCWERIEEKDEIREMPNCDHQLLFHRECLDRWLDEGHITCPLCRSSLIITTQNIINPWKIAPAVDDDDDVETDHFGE